LNGLKQDKKITRRDSDVITPFKRFFQGVTIKSIRKKRLKCIVLNFLQHHNPECLRQRHSGENVFSFVILNQMSARENHGDDTKLDTLRKIRRLCQGKRLISKRKKFDFALCYG